MTEPAIFSPPRCSSDTVSEPEAGQNFILDISIKDTRWNRAIADVADICSNAAKAAVEASQVSLAGAEAALVLSDDDFVAGLNKQYRDRHGATNVLSFAACDDPAHMESLASGMPVMLGDVVIAYETTAHEATEAGISLDDHLRHLVVHGVLHLLGYDHISREQAAVMEPLETLVLEHLGVADPYVPYVSCAPCTPDKPCTAGKGHV